MHVSFGVAKCVMHCRTSGFGGKCEVKLKIQVKQLKEDRLTHEGHKILVFWGGGGLKPLDPRRSATYKKAWIVSSTAVVT